MTTTTETNFDAIIIGGGPAGSTAAILLAKRDWRVAVIEKADFPRSKVCGEFISSTSFSVLEQIGIGDIWRAKAGPAIRKLALFEGQNCIEAPIHNITPDGLGRALGRDVLDEMLLSVARDCGVKIFQPCQAIGIKNEDDKQRVTILTPTSEIGLHAPVVVAAHGSWEQGPLPTHLRKLDSDDSFFGFKAYFKNAEFEPNLMSLLAFPGGYGGIVWADDNRLSVSCCIKRRVLSQIRSSSGIVSAPEAVHRHLIDSCLGVKRAIGGATRQANWHAAGPIRPDIRPAYQDDIFRIGNAAGEAHPVVAEGISMAIQSAYLLVAELSDVDTRTRSGRDLAGKRYSGIWRKQFGGRIHASSLFANVAAHPASARVATKLIRYVPSLLAVGANFAGKTKPLMMKHQ